MNSCFVTVGTTEFDSLVRAVSSEDALKTLASLGFRRLTLQIGRGSFEPKPGRFGDVEVDVYRYKASLREDMAQADLVISHAGAGTCLEALELNRALLVVVNETLMNNHQLELARQLKEDGHIEYCTPGSLKETLRSFDAKKLKPWLKGDPQLFVKWLDSYLDA